VAATRRIPRWFPVLLGVLLLPALVAASTGPKSAPSRELIDATIDLVQRALRSGDLESVEHACQRALILRPDCNDEQFKPVARSVSAGLRHKDPRVALACVRTLGKFHCPGSSHCLAPLLAPPRKVKDDWLPVHLAAIEVAGSLHESGSVPALEKLVQHDSQSIALASCAAMAKYKQTEARVRLDLIRRLANQLGRLERKKVKGEFAATELRQLRQALRDCLRVLTNDESLESAADARKWLRKQPKPGSEEEAKALRS